MSLASTPDTTGRDLSSRVRSSQHALHPRLEECVRRHLNARWQSGIHSPTRQAFDRLSALLLPGEHDSLILDSGCGTGASTSRLARRWPGHVVIGVDRSAARLAMTGGWNFPFRQGNCIWMRGELASFWRLALEAGWHPCKHFLLYPNPWPKPRHLKKRWHAHPVFPALLKLGGKMELRTNWDIYAREFACAARLASDREVSLARLDIREPLSPFEAKYQASGHSLWSVIVDT